MKLPLVDKTWTLFLDRDGVINQRIIGGYVLTAEQFIWLPGVMEALQILTARFGTSVVVTNQQGVGKGLMTEEDLASIHRRLLGQAKAMEVKLDAIYSCSALADARDINRKPAPGMAHQARAQFPQIEYAKSIMVGDSKSDIGFGESLGMVTVAIDRTADLGAQFRFDNLYDFARALEESQNI